MRASSILTWTALLAVASCAVGEDVSESTNALVDQPARDTEREAGSITAAPSADAATNVKDATTSDVAAESADEVDAGAATNDAGGDDADANVIDAAPPPANVLDPDVGLPSASGVACDPPGDLFACSGFEACRIASTSGGRCDDCFPIGACQGLAGASCSQSLDCDINLQCFRGKCTRFCALPQGTGCTGGKACVNVGHATVGLCDP